MDWLNGEDADAVAARIDQKLKAVEFAQLYKVFEDDPRAAALLKHWVDTIEQRDVPPSASLQEYAHFEGRRSFIRGIQRELKFAQTEGK
jgi:hypothetical protein